MLFTRFLCFALLIVFKSFAATIEIKGTVIDSNGRGLANATIELKYAKLVATSGQDGTFKLSGILEKKNGLQKVILPEITFSKKRFNIRVDRKTDADITIFDLMGKVQLHINKKQIQGIISFDLPNIKDGIYLMMISDGIAKKAYKVSVFNQNIGMETLHCGVEKSATRKNATLLTEDIILVKAQGYLNYNMKISKYIDSLNIIMQPSAGDVVDIDGNVYQCVRIGSQIWTVENYRSTKFNDGTPIKNVTSAKDWKSTDSIYCYYNNSSNPDSIKIFGAIYNCYTAVSSKLPPKGWHVPTMMDFDTLKAYLVANGYFYYSDDKLSIAKSIASKTYWMKPSTQGEVGADLTINNKSGFNVQPAGMRYSTGEFVRFGEETTFWTTTAYTPAYYFGMCLKYDESRFRSFVYENTCGLSIRLIKNN